MGFSRQAYWNGLPFPSPGDLPTQGLNQCLLLGRQILYHWATWKVRLVWPLSFARKGKAAQQLFRELLGQRYLQVWPRTADAVKLRELGGGGSGVGPGKRLTTDIPSLLSPCSLRTVHSGLGQWTNYFRFISIKPFTFTISPKWLESANG